MGEVVCADFETMMTARSWVEECRLPPTDGPFAAHAREILKK